MGWGGAEYEIDAEEGGSLRGWVTRLIRDGYNALGGTGDGDGRHISRSEGVLTRRLKLQGDGQGVGEVRVVPGDNIRLGGSIQSQTGVEGSGTFT